MNDENEDGSGSISPPELTESSRPETVDAPADLESLDRADEDSGDEAAGEGGDGSDDAAKVAGAVAAGVAGAAQAASGIANGDVAGTLGGLAGGAGGIAGAAGGEAGEAVQTGSQIANAAGQALGAGQSLAGGNVGDAASGLGDTSRYIVPDDQVQDVLGGVQSAAEMLDGAMSGLGVGTRNFVKFHVEVEGADGVWGVNHVNINEALNSVPTCQIEARYHGSLESKELLRREVSLSIERGEERREFKGIVMHARVDCYGARCVMGAHAA